MFRGDGGADRTPLGHETVTQLGRPANLILEPEQLPGSMYRRIGSTLVQSRERGRGSGVSEFCENCSGLFQTGSGQLWAAPEVGWFLVRNRLHNWSGAGMEAICDCGSGAKWMGVLRDTIDAIKRTTVRIVRSLTAWESRAPILIQSLQIHTREGNHDRRTGIQTSLLISNSRHSL